MRDMAMLMNDRTHGSSSLACRFLILLASTDLLIRPLTFLLPTLIEINGTSIAISYFKKA